MNEKLFLQIRSINIVYPNKENMIAVSITKIMEIIISIQICLISRINFDYMENGGKKSFSFKSIASISCIPIWTVVPITNRIETVISIQIYPISWMNINYKKNGEKKSFCCKSKASILWILMWRTRF